MPPSKNIALLILVSVLLNQNSIQAQSVYELYETKDGALIGLGIPFSMAGFAFDLSVDSLSENEIKTASRDNVNKFDRFATYYYSEKASNWSDILVISCIAAPLTLLIPKKTQNDKGTILVMYAEAILLGTSLPALSKGIFSRFRPFVYNQNVTLEKKLSPDAQKSFFSGHTSVAFTAMIFFSTVYAKYYPDSDWRPFIWGSSIFLASAVGYLRVVAGAHFPSDVITGALVGGLVGYIIPRIHETDSSTSLMNIGQSPPVQQIFSLNFNF